MPTAPLFLGDPAVVTAPLDAADVEALRRQLRAGIDPHAPRRRSEIRTGDRHRRARATTPRISRWSTASATRSPTPTRSISATASAWWPKAPASCSTTSSTISPPSPAAPNAYGLVGGDANAPGPGKRPLSSMTPDHRAQERPAVHRHRLARRQPHHHRGAAGRRQRDRPRHGHRRRGGGAAHPSSMVAGRGARSSAGRRRDVIRALEARGHKIERAAAMGLGQHDPGDAATGFVGAADPRTRGASPPGIEHYRCGRSISGDIETIATSESGGASTRFLCPGSGCQPRMPA